MLTKSQSETRLQSGKIGLNSKEHHLTFTHITRTSTIKYSNMFSKQHVTTKLPRGHLCLKYWNISQTHMQNYLLRQGGTVWKVMRIKGKESNWPEKEEPGSQAETKQQ